MRKLIIADIKSNNNGGICTGHYYALAQNYLDTFSDVTEVKIASGPMYLRKFDCREMILLPCDYVAGENKLKNVWRMLRNGWSLFRQVNKNDVIVIQQSQPAMIMFTLLLTCFRKAGVFQIQYSEEPMNRLYYRFMISLKRKYIKGTLCPNETVGKAYRVPYLVVPDYFYNEKEQMRPPIEYANRKYDFCSVGRIAYDKGVADAAEALAGKSFTYLIAGTPQVKTEEERIVRSSMANSNIITDLSYISNEKYVDYIRNSRYCIMNYSGSYSERSSGVVLDVLFTGVPIVGKRCKALKFVEDMNLGVLYDDINQIDFDYLLNQEHYKVFLESIAMYKKSLTVHKERAIEFFSIRE